MLKGMKRKIKFGTVALVCTVGIICMNSCLKIDERYDLDKEIDKTVSVGGNLTIPASYTEKMILKDLLKLEDDGIIVADSISGDYMLRKNGERSFTKVKIPTVTVDMSEGFEGVEYKFTVPQIPLTLQNNQAKNSFIQTAFREFININISQDDITPDIKDLKSSETSCVETYLVFTETGNAANVVLNNNFYIEFPNYIKVKSEDKSWIAEGNKLILNKADGMEISEKTKVKFQIINVNFIGTDARFTPGEGNGKIDLRGNITLNGNVSLYATNADGGDMAVSVDVESEYMNIETVEAIVDPEINLEINPIVLDDMPNFLTDNEILMDLTDPRIFIKVANPSPIAVNMSGTLKSVKTGKDSKTVKIPEFTIPAAQDTRYKDGNITICLNQIEDGNKDGIIYVKADRLSTIVENIPEKIEITEIETNVVQEFTEIELGEEYQIETDYIVNTPLMFGPRTKFKYTEVIDGWDTDLKDAEFERIEVTMTVINEIPLGLNLKAEAIDKEGNKLENVDVDMNVDINPGSIGNTTNQEVSFNVTTTEGSIKALDGIRLYIEANASKNTETVALNENQSVQIANLKLKLIGGVTIDLN